MKTKLFGLIVMLLLLCPAPYVKAQVSIGIGLPNLSIGINLPMYPTLAPVPGYPVYYAPQVDGNYFFYDSMYWVYQGDNWYASSWYNGPWAFVDPMSVPLFVLRIPVRYYQQPPAYFRGWQSNAPPRWGQQWGNDWEHRRSGWDRWNHKAVPTRAPQPTYQRQYTGDRYPHVEQQRELRNQSYRYQPRDKAVRQHIQQQSGQINQQPAQRVRQEPQNRNPQPVEQQQPAQHRPGTGQPVPQQQNPAVHEQRQQPTPQQREQQAPRAQGQQERGAVQDSGHDRGQGRDKEDDRGRGR